MKAHRSLYTKIVLWFFLNLVLLAAVAYSFYELRFRLNPESPLLGQPAHQLRAVGRLISGELASTPRADWGDSLGRFAEAYGLDFLVVNDRGERVAGRSMSLPLEVREKLTPRQPRPTPAIPPTQPPMTGHPLKGLSGITNNNPRPESTLPPASVPQGNQPVFLVRTTGPTRFWLGLPIDLPGVSTATLMAVTDSLAQQGIVTDPMPWMTAVSAAVLVSLLFWVPLVRSMTRSISQVTKATEKIAEGQFDARVDTRRQDEIGRLGQAINHLTARLDGYVTGQKRFLGDIAHELCSPLARAQAALGILEQRAQDEKHQQYITDVQEEVEHMTSLINELLLFSKAGLKKTETQLQPVDLAAITAEVIEREANDKAELKTDIPENLRALSEPTLLGRSVGNLVRNAIRYAGEGGPITIAAQRAGERVLLTVTDQGPGLPPEILPRIFDPFYRPEPDRGRNTGGAGLGLAIVQSCMEACQGTVSCENRELGGLEFTLSLPAAD